MIRLNNINKIYHAGGSVTVALNDLTLCIDDGEAIAITGASGSGKSSLLNIIGCLDADYTGGFMFDDVDVTKLDVVSTAWLRREKIGFIFQQYHLIQDLNVYENIELPLIYADISRKERKQKVIDTLSLMGISDKIYNKPNELSGGQQQRVAIARAIVGNPSYILADEPTGALDSKTGLDIMSALLEINRKGTGLIVVTHDGKVANQLSRIITISDGKIVSDVRNE